MNNQQLQTALIDRGLLDPPADGLFGPQSFAAVAAYKAIAGIPITAPLDAVKESLAKGKDPIPLRLENNTLASRIMRAMVKKGYFICRGEQRYNNVYLEGANKDGSPNEDDKNPDKWTDRSLLIEIPSDGIPVIVGNWEGTTEPGRYWTEIAPDRHPLGAARVALAQHMHIWNVGMHRGNHEALVQTAGSIVVFRDKNKNYSREDDKAYEGYFGINQHGGYDALTIGNTSAGCMLRRFMSDQATFMRFNKSDRRYRANRGYAFSAAVMLATDLLNI